ASRVSHVASSGVDAAISGLTITGGRQVTGFMEGAVGGGILVDMGDTLTVDSCTISGNTAGSGGGIWTRGTLTVNNSTISGNTGGGLINIGATVIVSGSTMSGNVGAGLSTSWGTVSVSNSTISGNSGTGIFNNFCTLTVTSS